MHSTHRYCANRAMACVARKRYPGLMPPPSATTGPARALAAGALATLALTAAHHAYGALRYDTPWRLHGALVAVAIAIPVVLLHAAHARAPDRAGGRAAGWALFAIGAVVVVGIGGF